ncbi:hypothetical protein [Serratia inhibens]|uniref:hypothetical protein n=1 Tax=Serratia inhibens TaxID=2338073 RepID=UPI000809398A|nr:hypothetical protein [Serratia inhibens]ANS44760.1 hypothetical protein Q5A_021715 [Serratia inhibens PRI-2C]
MLTAADIITSLSEKTKTLGWDAVVAYDRDKINHLFQQQYISKLAAGTHFPPISWSNQRNTIQLENITLSAPRISFTNASTESSSAVATLEFLDGNVIERDFEGQVNSYIRIRPGMGYGLTLNVDLIAGTGSVDEQGRVQIDFSKGTVTIINAIHNPPAEMLAFFQQWLANNAVTYELGQLSLQDLGSDLTPKKFVIRTQQAPVSPLRGAEDYGDGAVLLFVATNVNPEGGSLPTVEFPWLIPQGCSSTILVNSRLVLERYLKPELDKMLASGQWELVRGTQDDDAFALRASANATINGGRVRTTPLGSITGIDLDFTWSGDYKAPPDREILEDFIYSLKGGTLWLNRDMVMIDFNKGYPFQQKMAACFSHHGGGITGPIWDRATLTFSLSRGAAFELVLDQNTETIGITHLANSVSVNSNFIEEWKNLAASKNVANAIHFALRSEIESIVRNLMEDIKFKDIEVFALNHVLFPEHNINRLKSAHMPGDMVIFGEIDASLTSLELAPLQTVLPVGKSQQFTTNASSGVTYSLSPAHGGAISASGLYRAPMIINGGVLGVTVTAKTATATATAHITVVSSPVEISPAFFALHEGDPHAVQLNTMVLGDENTTLNWSLTSSTPGVTGSISRDGFYIPPGEAYPLGYTYVTATAISSEGWTSQVYILLISYGTFPEFNITPPFVTSLAPGAVQTLSADATLDFDPNDWACYPALGTLSRPVQEGSTYRVKYTAPATVNADELVIVRAIQQGKAHRAGYAVIDVAAGKLK